ncbi:hypothetical protein P691DRAFT_764707 [Macrolepiota fuliginosa MF-IS2]|uniref:Uncharacterized protein n=1 Tax=Macrolepiota fuliginosa MF-IS2 TaxID=1400762 RepID=A0A9P5X524_9AGAR|nr:hypothetical protein P691DRAFT_764707 [Macrolepiota fuliginosa MF-IS2]
MAVCDFVGAGRVFLRLSALPLFVVLQLYTRCCVASLSTTTVVDDAFWPIVVSRSGTALINFAASDATDGDHQLELTISTSLTAAGPGRMALLIALLGEIMTTSGRTIIRKISPEEHGLMDAI